MTMLSHSMHDTLCFQSPVGVFKRSQDHDIHNAVSYVMQITQKHFLHHIEKIQKPSLTVFLLSLKKEDFCVEDQGSVVITMLHNDVNYTNDLKLFHVLTCT